MKKLSKIHDLLRLLVPVVLLNTVVSLIISLPLFKLDSQPDNYFAIKLIIFISHYFSLNLLTGIIIFLLSVALPRRLAVFTSTLFFFIIQVLLVIDMKIFTIYHYHLNSLVWNIITAEGVTDSVILGKGTLTSFAVMLVAFLAVEAMINIFFSTCVKKMSEEKRIFLSRTSICILIAGLCLIVIDKGSYAYADLYNNTNITGVRKLYPLYQPLTMKRFASRVLGFNVIRENNFRVTKNTSLLNYPKNSLTFNPAADRRYNILLILVEGLRFDMLDSQIMPNVWNFTKESRTYKNHYSGGNCSRFGTFSLMYGISGTYWHDFLAKRIPPVLIDTLMDKGYDFRILSSTRLTFPEFRKTVFLRVPEYIEDNVMPYGGSVNKDRIITEKTVDYLSRNNAAKPFFVFLFYNSSHQPYRYPAEFGKFHPVISKEDINYMEDIGKDTALKMKNRFRNSIYYEDHLIGKIIAALKDKNLLDNTVVLITGDHGEEFYENGFLGHTSSFNDYQTKTVFVLHVPGASPGTITRKTSHTDLVPTLMTLLGCTSPSSTYSQGISLLSDKRRQYVSSASWDTASIIDDEFEIAFSTRLYNIGSFEIYRKGNYSPVKNTKDIMKQKKHLLLDFAQKMSEFYK